MVDLGNLPSLRFSRTGASAPRGAEDRASRVARLPVDTAGTPRAAAAALPALASATRVIAAAWLVFVGSPVALAAPPGPPTGETPPNGAQDVAAHPQLCVDVTDPDGDLLDVRFFGRRVTAEPFTIIVLPDTQYYTRDNPNIFYSQTDWIVANEDDRNIVFVSHVGDMVQTGSNAGQWNVAENAMSRLEDPVETELPDGLAYGQAPGNHDQAPIGTPRSGGNESSTTQQYRQRFGKHRFEGRVYYGDAFDFNDPEMYPDNNDNNYEFFSAGGMDFIVFHLEFDNADSPQRDSVLNWLDNTMMLHSDRRAIVTSHYILHPLGFFSDQGAAIRETIKDNPNAFAMLSGHVTEAQRRTDLFEGNRLYSLLSDYQNRTAGGNGWLRIMTFDPESDTITVETYSPWLNSYDRGAAHDFSLHYEMDGPLPFRTIGIAREVPSGGTACLTWPGKRIDERYEWHVDVSDAESSTTGERWTFLSDGQCTFDSDCIDGDGCTADTCVAGTCEAPTAFDGDRDGACEDVDNCQRRFNHVQLDSDGDGLGDLCDVCANDIDAAQVDDDRDGSGDACDCQYLDPNDREPARIERLLVSRTGADVAHLSWTPALGADTYSLTRGDLSSLAAGSYGDCLIEGLETTMYDDPDVPLPGEGYFYVVQGQNFDCGLGLAGYTSEELPRDNLDPDACMGHSHTDARAVAEETIYGTPTGTYDDTSASDDVWESVMEELSHGNPSLRHSRLEHRWTVDVPAGGLIEFHVEGYRTNSLDGDDFAFDYSTDGGSSWTPIALVSLPTADNGIDLVGTLPSSLSGSLQFRVVDTDRNDSNRNLDTVSIDDLFVRSIP